MRSLSLRARLTIWCVTVVVAVVAFCAMGVLIMQQQIGIRRIDRDLDATHAQLTSMLREELREVDAPRSAAEESLNVMASAIRPIAILSDTGAVLATRFDSLNLAGTFRHAPSGPEVRTLDSGSGQWRVHVRRETLEGATFLLIVASPMSDLARDQRDIREAILLGIPIALLLAGAGGLWLASVGLRPITIMARRAASIPLTGADDLGPPIRDDELGQLTRAFNALVARLRSALHTQRQFMADASHELRSPVSVIRTASDVALNREHRDEWEYREALATTAAQSRRLSTLVDDMLVLARADAGGYPLRPVDFFIDDVIDECRQAVSVLAAARRVTVTTTGASELAMHGDQELLKRLLVNLLQNAVQHTPGEGIVSVDVSVNGSDVRIRVVDSGSGIPAEDVDRIFDRFVRLDPSRRSEGAGLGLTIARWIAEAHGGSVTVESSSPRGTTFCVALPASSRIVRKDGAAHAASRSPEAKVT